MDPDTNEQDFLVELVKHYRTLGDAEKNELLDTLLHQSSSVQWEFVESIMPNLWCRDYLALLPLEICEHILSYCDDATLFAACQVSKRWNDIVSVNRLWWEKLKHLGLTTTQSDELELNRRKETCKSTYRRMARLMTQMICGSAFLIDKSTFVEHVDYILMTKVYGSYLIGVSEVRVYLWYLETGIKLAEQAFPEHDRVFCVKCDDNIMLLSFWRGGMASYFLPSLQLDQIFSRTEDSGHLFSIDLILSLDLIVCGHIHGAIKLWSYSKGTLLDTLHRHHSRVLRVILGLPPQNSKKENAILISIDLETIFVWAVPQTLSKQGSTSSTEVICTAELPHRTNHNCLTEYLVGRNLYYTQDIMTDFHPSKITSWLHQFDVLACHQVRQVKLAIQVKRLLAAGARYLCMWSEMRDQVEILDVLSGQLISSVYIPPMSNRTPIGISFKIGCTNWLDGFNGINNEGILLVMVKDFDVAVVKWKEELTCPQDCDNE